MSGEQQPASVVSKAWDAVSDWTADAGHAIGDGMQAYGEMKIQQAQIQQAAAQADLAALKHAAHATGQAVHDIMKTNGEMAIRGSEYRVEATRQQVEVIKHGAEAVKNQVEIIWDDTVIHLAGAVIAGVKLYRRAETCVAHELAKHGDQPGDGQYMGKECAKTSKQWPAEGVKPKGCANCPKSFPKIIYTNGINTKPQAACATMHKIANSRCAEVFGIYNATDGPKADFVNANETIEGHRHGPAAATLSQTIRDFAAHGEHLTLYAHSEGGLNSIAGLRDAYDRMRKDYGDAYADAAMRNITVISFGTAVTGWPDGPSYTQYTNWSDPVPHIIADAQLFSGLPVYRSSVTDAADAQLRKSKGSTKRNQPLAPARVKWLPDYLPQGLFEIFQNNPTRARNLRMAKNTAHVFFTQPSVNLIDSHSMDNVYLQKLNSKNPVIKGPDGSCCG